MFQQNQKSLIPETPSSNQNFSSEDQLLNNLNYFLESKPLSDSFISQIYESLSRFFYYSPSYCSNIKTYIQFLLSSMLQKQQMKLLEKENLNSETVINQLDGKEKGEIKILLKIIAELLQRKIFLYTINESNCLIKIAFQPNEAESNSQKKRKNIRIFQNTESSLQLIQKIEQKQIIELCQSVIINCIDWIIYPEPTKLENKSISVDSNKIKEICEQLDCFQHKKKQSQFEDYLYYKTENDREIEEPPIFQQQKTLTTINLNLHQHNIKPRKHCQQIIPEEPAITELQNQENDYSQQFAFFRANSEQLFSPYKELKRRKTSIEIIREEIAESKIDISDENLLQSKQEISQANIQITDELVKYNKFNDYPLKINIMEGGLCDENTNDYSSSFVNKKNSVTIQQQQSQRIDQQTKNIANELLNMKDMDQCKSLQNINHDKFDQFQHQVFASYQFFPSDIQTLTQIKEKFFDNDNDFQEENEKCQQLFNPEKKQCFGIVKEFDFTSFEGQIEEEKEKEKYKFSILDISKDDNVQKKFLQEYQLKKEIRLSFSISITNYDSIENIEILSYS